MQQRNVTAIVLRRTNYQEADRILTVLSEELGKISVIAKGARRAKSKLAGGIELFAVNDLTVIKGKSDLHTLTSSRVKTSYSHIVKDIDRTMKAYEYIKLIDKTVDEHAVEEGQYFELLRGGLEGLDLENLDPNLVDIWFYLHALHQSGMVPDLQKDIGGNKLERDKYYTFASSDMQFQAAESGAFSSDHIKLLRVALQKDKAIKLSNIQVDSAIITTCSGLVRNMAEHNLL